MSIHELEQQLLSLDLAQRIRILQLLAQSLTVPRVLQPSPSPDELSLTRDGEPPAGGDRTPQHLYVASPSQSLQILTNRCLNYGMLWNNDFTRYSRLALVASYPRTAFRA